MRQYFFMSLLFMSLLCWLFLVYPLEEETSAQSPSTNVTANNSR